MKSFFRFALIAAAIALMTTAARAADAQENWTKNCKKCHGDDGSGKTPVGRKLHLKDYTDPAVQAEMTDDEMFEATKNGVEDTKMPAYGEKGLSDDEIHDLVAFIRSLKKE